MQLLILFLSPLLLNIFPNRFLVPSLANRADVVPLRPKFPSPQLLLHLGNTSKYFSRSNTPYRLYKLLRAIHRNRLNQKVNMIFICPDLYKLNLISLGNFDANFL